MVHLASLSLRMLFEFKFFLNIFINLLKITHYLPLLHGSFSLISLHTYPFSILSFLLPSLPSSLLPLRFPFPPSFPFSHPPPFPILPLLIATFWSTGDEEGRGEGGRGGNGMKGEKRGEGGGGDGSGEEGEGQIF